MKEKEDPFPIRLSKKEVDERARCAKWYERKPIVWKSKNEDGTKEWLAMWHIGRDWHLATSCEAPHGDKQEALDSIYHAAEMILMGTVSHPDWP